MPPSTCFVLFFFNDTATTEIYTLSLHDALPIWRTISIRRPAGGPVHVAVRVTTDAPALTPLTRAATCTGPDRKSTRLNSSHMSISYAVFCLKKKKNNKINIFNQRTTTLLHKTYT